MAERKKSTRKSAAKKESPMDELMAAVKKAEDAGFQVRVYVAKVDDDGVTEERTR